MSLRIRKIACPPHAAEWILQPSDHQGVALPADKLFTQLNAFLDEYRSRLRDSLDGLTEEEARMRLVPSKTTLLGLVKHVTYVEGVWFDEAITGRSYREIGIPSTPNRSFTLRRDDTIASVQAAHRAICEVSRRNTAGLGPHDIVRGRGGRHLWQIHLHMLRELAQHQGHADILREQILAARAG
jgi:hypothetical protein